MKINHGRVAGMPSTQRGETFTGSVWSEPLLRDVPGVVINTVFFPPGVRTHWHAHENGQILIVTHGGTMRAIRSHVTDEPQHPIANCGVYEVHFRDDRLALPL